MIELTASSVMYEEIKENILNQVRVSQKIKWNFDKRNGTSGLDSVVAVNGIYVK